MNSNYTKYMRNVYSRAFVLALTLFGLGAFSSRVMAQRIDILIQFTNSWRYDQSGTNVGAVQWQTNTFNDTAWSLGLGLLGFDTTPAVYTVHAPINTSLNIGSPTSPLITYYFRTHFTWPPAGISGIPSGTTLYASNLVDDGCVIFLNGIEAGRLRVPTGQTFSTLASGGPPTEGNIEVLTISTNRLRIGDNLIAVEVHQGATDSSDVMWGMKLLSFTPTALSITSQPQSQTVQAGSPVTFTVGISGGPVTSYQWQKNSNNITGGTGATYTISSAQPSDSGAYRVIVTGPLGSVTSSNAILTVSQDTSGPVPISAVVSETSQTNRIDILFDEVPMASTVCSTCTNNVRLLVSGTTNNFVVVSNLLQNARTVRLVVGGTNWVLGSNYYVLLNSISDTNGNFIAPNTVIGVSWPVRTNLTQMSDVWRFYDCGDPTFCDPTFPAIYTNTTNPWYGTNYVINELAGLWGSGNGILYIDPNNQGQLCAGDSFMRLISFQNYPTLFRRTFNLATNFGSSGMLQLRYIIDDGMILYLNGREIHRYNMPGAPGSPWDQNTKAPTTITVATCITNTVTVTNLLPRTNWLAAAVFQGPTAESDTIFGLEMDGIFNRTSPTPGDAPTNQLRLTIARQGSGVRLAWPWGYYGYDIQFKTNLGPGMVWQQVKDQTYPYTNSTTAGPNRFYRLFK